jgi:hypothetical protein
METRIVNAQMALVPAHQPMTMADMQMLAKAIAASGLFGIKTPDAALVLMSIAQAEGRHPVEAARDYDVINGKPAKRAEAMLRDFLQAGGAVEWHSLTDELADATFTHPQTGKVRIDWDMKRARTAFGPKDMYTKFPRQMLRSRVVSEGIRTLWPLATSGLYVPEEVADIPHTGPTLEHTRRDAVNDAVPLKAAAAATPKPERVVDPTVYDTPPKSTPPVQRTDEAWRAWLIKLRDAVGVLRYRSEVEDVAAKDTVGSALASGPPWVKREIDSILADAFARFPEEPQDELPEVEIAGEERLGAG